MKKENIKTFYVRMPETMESLTKDEIFSGLSSKDLKQKEKTLNYLIINILNDPYCDQLIMPVLNHILPYQKNSITLKKLLLIYWEIIQKRKLNGEILDEFMMVCNNLRKDLTHANEYVVGMSLKLISRIAMKDILDALLPPIYNKCFNHIEAFVRRNTVECLFALYERFGEELLPDLDGKMVELLGFETDVNTRRNAIILLFKVNPMEALNFLLNKMEDCDLGDFGDTTQLAIVKYLFVLCEEDPSNKSKYMKILFEFMSSKFSGVLFEISNNIVNYTNNWNALSTSVSQLLKILQETPDTNVKLIIVEKLKFFKGLGNKLIVKNMPELLKIIEKEGIEVKVKTLKIILDLIGQNEVEKFLEILEGLIFDLFKDLNKNRNHKKLHKYIIKSLIHLTQKKISNKIQLNESQFLEIFFSIVLHKYTDKSLMNNVKNLINLVLYKKKNFSPNINTLILEKLLYIKTPDLIKTMLTLYVEDLEDLEDVKKVLMKLRGHVGSFKNKVLKIDERESVSVKKEKIFRSKTVVREDGTYGTELVEEFCGDLQGDEFEFISSALLKDSVFVVNFYRNLLVLVSKLDRKDLESKKLSSYFIYGILLVYKYYQKNDEKDKSLFKELNIIVKKMAQGETCEKRIKPKKKMSFLESENETKKPQTSLSQFNDLIAFRQLKGKMTIDLEYDEQNIINKKTTTKSQKNFNSKYKNLIQLTGYSDPIYAEAFVCFNKHNIDLEIYLLNRTESVLKNININFYSILTEDTSATNLRLMDKLKTSYIRREESIILHKTLQYNAAKEFKLFAEISYQNNAGIIMGYMKTNEISFNILDFLEKKKCEGNKFREIWEDCDWENKVKICVKGDLDCFLKEMESVFSVGTVEELSVRTQRFNTFCFYSRFSLGKDLLMNVCVEVGEGKVVGDVRLRSQNKGVVFLVGKHVRMMFNE